MHVGFLKKSLLILLLFLCVGSLCYAAEDSSVLFLWGKNDAEVNYFRYSIDEKEWSVVGTEQRDAFISYTKNEDHTFVIQQSYDGEHWSEPYSVQFSHKPVEVTTEKRDYDHFVSCVTFVPFETYIAMKAHGNSRNYNSKYAAGLEMSTFAYLQEYYGLGVSLDGTFAYIGATSRTLSFNWATYVVSAFRLVSREDIDVVVEVGLGAQYEFVNGVFYVSPSAKLEASASLNIYENLSLSVSPSVAASISDFKFSSDFLAYNIKAIAIGIEYKI